METQGLRNDELADAIREAVQLLEFENVSDCTRELLHNHLRDLLRVQVMRATFVPVGKLEAHLWPGASAGIPL